MEKHKNSHIEKSSSSPEDDSAGFEYKLLKGHFLPDGKTYRSDKELRIEYLRLTDNLIHTIQKGTEVKNEETGEKEAHPFSRIIFLDKSGRPLSHLVRDFWPTFAKDLETGEIPPMPHINFLNIDRQQWTTDVDPDGAGIVNVDNLKPNIIQSLRSIGLTSESKKSVSKEGLNESVADMPSVLDGEHVLIVDETYSTGRTAKIASALLSRAYPKTHFNTTHWMRESFTRNGVSFNTVPVWYRDDSKMGRGVNDRYADFSATDTLDRSLPENYYRTIGRWFLSAPHWFANPNIEDTSDESYRQLIREFKQLASHPDVPILPSIARDDYEDRIVAYNTDRNPLEMTDDEKDEVISQIAREKQCINKDSQKHSIG